ncbi:Uncharacterized protein APZ42_025219 [Daphnia magna]|uniref:Secreted protein n=1 Tax=Daphnia magna TaxID=35525 RepID=A0A164TC17_9CRUS|nr:Uncharacterized protein APZ42_025219 [Daphnia magna]
MVCWSAACVCLVVYLLQVIFEPEAFRVSLPHPREPRRRFTSTLFFYLKPQIEIRCFSVDYHLFVFRC